MKKINESIKEKIKHQFNTGIKIQKRIYKNTDNCYELWIESQVPLFNLN